MRDYTKLVILGSTALLVLLTVIMLLAFSGQPRQTPNPPPEPAQKTDTAGGQGGGGGQQQNGTPPAGALPDTLELGNDYTLPCEATLEAIVEKYYKGVTLHNGALLAYKHEQVPLITARLAKLNTCDAKVKLRQGTTLHLPRLYVVSSGDTLESISKKIYNDNKHVKDIFDKNTPDPVKKKNEISPGMVLILP